MTVQVFNKYRLSLANPRCITANVLQTKVDAQCDKTCDGTALTSVEMPFGVWTWVGPGKHVSDGCTLAQPGKYDWTVHVRRQITLITCYYYYPSVHQSINQSINWNHTSAKAHLTSAAIRIRIRYPDRHQNLIISSLAHCRTSIKISCKSVQKFLRKVAKAVWFHVKIKLF